MTNATDAPASARTDQHSSDLRVVSARTLRGPNVVRLAPVIVAELRAGTLASTTPNGESDFMTRLLDALPAIGGEVSATGAPPDDTALPRSWGDALLRVVNELQRMAGSPPVFGSVLVDAPESDRWSIAIGFDDEDLAHDAIYEGERILRDCLRGDDPEIHATVSDLARRYARARPDAATLALIEAARRRGIPVRRNDDDGTVQLGLGATLRRIRSTITDRTSVIASEIARSERSTRSVLERLGLKTLERDEQQAPEHGRLHRVLVVGRHVVACAERSPVTGMSDSGVNPTAHRHDADEEAEVSERPEYVWTDRTDDMHPANRALCELVAGAVGLDVAGIDVITPDIAVHFQENGAVVTRVHHGPDIGMHTNPDEGASRDVTGAILDMLYPPGAPFTIPVFAITGTNGKTTTTRLIAHLFRTIGKRVGYTTTDGVYFQDNLLLEGDLTGPFAANIILSHQDVEVAVIETARGGIVRAGLGFDECDVGIVLNVTSDHLGIGGIDTLEQLADVKGVIPAVVKPGGMAVLNADDPLVLDMRRRTPGRVALFSAAPADEIGTTSSNQVLEAHLDSGGIVARIETESERPHFVIREGTGRFPLASVEEVPLTFGGTARFQFENVLAASLAAYAQGLPVERIRAGLLGFKPSAHQTPGRLNMFETSRGRVIHDYAHNAAAISGLLDFVMQMPATHRIAIISVPGDRRDEDLREVGRRAAAMDYVVFKEHAPFRRGRAAGESAALLAAGLLETGFPADRVATFDNEHDGVQHAIGLMRAGDVVVLVADSDQALELFDAYRVDRG